MIRVRRCWHRLTVAYRLRCAREDAAKLNIIPPLGVWVCHHCPGVSLTEWGFHAHLRAAHP
jgi:hypothetical protein